MTRREELTRELIKSGETEQRAAEIADTFERLSTPEDDWRDFLAAYLKKRL